MNIEQIAMEVAQDMGQTAYDSTPQENLPEFLRRCLSKLAEQAGEPVGFMDDQGVLWETVDGNQLPSDVPLYTEAQYLAAQQRTAEACAKVCEIIDEEYEGEDVLGAWCSEAIRNGEWREYL